MLPWAQEGSECWRSVDPPSLRSLVCLYYWLLYSPPIFCFDYRWSILLVCFLLIPLSTLALFLLDEEDNLLCSVSHENFFSNHLPGYCLDSNSPRPVRRGWDTFWVIISLLLWFICYYGWLEGLYLTKCLTVKNYMDMISTKLVVQTSINTTDARGESLETPKTCLKYVISKTFYHHWSSSRAPS